jgi:hypothetical protein
MYNNPLEFMAKMSYEGYSMGAGAPAGVIHIETNYTYKEHYMNTEFKRSLAQANKQIAKLALYQPTMLAALKGLSERAISTQNIRQEADNFINGVAKLNNTAHSW